MRYPETPTPASTLGETGIDSLTLASDQHGSVSDRVHQALRNAIIAVRLAPGSPISENSICRQFEVSRTPVRAALKRLQEEGLVEVFPQQGSYVSPIRLAGLMDSHFVRRSLEVGLLRELAAKGWRPEMSRHMREAVAEQERAFRKNDADGFFVADEEFHHLFATFAEREGVWQAILSAKVGLTRFHRYWAKPGRIPDVIAEHLAIIDALDRGDTAAAEKALVTHLDMVFVIYEQMPEETRKVLSP